MKSYPRKPNNIKKSEEASKEKQENQKARLIEQMKKKQFAKKSKLVSATSPPKKAPSSPNNEIGPLKNQITDLERQLKKVRKAAAEDKKKMKALKRQIKLHEEEVQQMIEKNNREVEAIKKAAAVNYQEAEAMMNQLRALGWDEETNAIEAFQQLSEWTLLLLQQASKTSRQLKNVQKKSQTTNQKNKNLEEKNQHLEVENKRLKTTLSQKDQKIKQLGSEIRVIQDKQHELLQEIKKQQSTDPQELLPRLIQHLDNRTFRSYNQLNQLFEKYQRLFDSQAYMFHEQQTDVLYGFLEVGQEDQLFFHDINEEFVLPVTVHKGFKRKDLIVDGMAIQVFRKAEDPDSVALGYCYPVVERQDLRTRQLRKKQRMNATNEPQSFLANEKVSAWASELTVTIVGNKQVQDLVDHLKKVVKKAVGVDAYEKGERRTVELMRSADYTVVFVDSTPHGITNFAKEYDPLGKKIQVIHSSTRPDILLWLNYLYWNREE